MAVNIEGLVRANEGYLTALYTEPGYGYTLNRSRGRRRSRFSLDPLTLNSHFLGAQSDQYGLNGIDAGSFYKLTRETSVKAMWDIQKGVLPSHRMIGVHNELEVHHNRAALRLERIAGIKASGKPVALDLSWQSLVDVVLTHGAALIEAKKIKTGLDDALTDLHNWLSERLYSGEEGERHPYPYHSFHDPITNRTIAVGTTEQFARDPYITREHTLYVRHLKGGGFVHTNARVKEVTATEKLVDDALENGGELKTENIRDMAGIQITVIGERPMRERVVQQVVEILEGYPLKSGEIFADDETGKNRGQNPMEWKRIKVPIGGIDPVEIIVKTLADDVDQQEDLGKYNSETGQFRGDGHRPFERRRKLRLLRAFHPGFIYKPQDLDLEDAIRQGGWELREEMMRSGVVEIGRGNKNKTHRRPLCVEITAHP